MFTGFKDYKSFENIIKAYEMSVLQSNIDEGGNGSVGVCDKKEGLNQV